MKSIVGAILIVLSFAGICPAKDPDAARAATNARTLRITPAFINELADEARTNNPSLLAADARVRAAEAGERGVRIWDDPELRVGKMAAEKMMRAEEGDLLYGVEQKLPLFGKPQAERRRAQAETKVEQADAEARFQFLRRDIAEAVFRTALADRVVEIGRQDLDWLETMVAVAERRYETGDATQFDVLRLQNERSQRETRLQTDRELLKQDRVNLNRLLNRPLDSSWPVLQLPDLAGPVPFTQRLANLAVRYAPELAVRRNEVGVAEAAVDVAKRERYPDVSVGAEARNYTGTGEYRQSMFMLSFSFPWGNRKRYQAGIQRQEEKLKAVQLDVTDMELALRTEIHNLTVKIDAARREAITYRDEIIPRSETALESARATWETNRGSLRDVLDARRMLLDAQLMQARAVTEQYELLSELVLCCGLGDLEALQMLGALPEDEPAPDTRP